MSGNECVFHNWVATFDLQILFKTLPMRLKLGGTRFVGHLLAPCPYLAITHECTVSHALRLRCSLSPPPPHLFMLEKLNGKKAVQSTALLACSVFLLSPSNTNEFHFFRLTPNLAAVPHVREKPFERSARSSLDAMTLKSKGGVFSM